MTTARQGIYTIRQDHELIRNNIEKIQTLNNNTDSADLDQKQRLLNDTIKLLSQHDVAEEVLFYPTVRNVGCEEYSKMAIDQTEHLETLLYEIDQEYGYKIDNTNFTMKFDKFSRILLNHITLEENSLLPILETQLSGDQLESLNFWFEKIKALAPTRPHPEGPHSAAAKLATGPVVAFIDKFRDLSKKFST